MAAERAALCLARTNAQDITDGVLLSTWVPADVLLFSFSWLTWELEFRTLLFTVSTNIRLLNAERTLTTFSSRYSFPFASEESVFSPPLSDITHLDEMLGLPRAGGGGDGVHLQQKAWLSGPAPLSC